MDDSDIPMFVSGDPGSCIHCRGITWQLGMRKEMAERQPGQLALGRAATQKDLFRMLGLSLQEEPPLLGSTCMQSKTKGCFPSPALCRGSREGHSRLRNDFPGASPSTHCCYPLGHPLSTLLCH